MRSLFYIFISGFALVSCSGEEPETIHDQPVNEPTLKIISPANDDQFIVGDEVNVEIVITDSSKVKNLQFYFADTLYAENLNPVNQKFTVATPNGKVGFTKIYFSYTDEKGENHGDTRTIVFFSDIKPQSQTASIVTTYPHDKSSYTQGLEFYQGKLFEGTGRNGLSILGEVDLQTGNILRKIDIENNYFGEGITILNDTIYQITWNEGKCLVYNMNFEKIKEFNYDGEGWGLCNDGEYLIMSNGSNQIVWRNRNTFEIVKSIYVFSDETDTAQLNELELVNGHLLVNVYMEDYIIEVDTATGKVLSEINCSSLVKDGRVAGADVLNGIAYNPKTSKLYMTGKWWPKLYEVRFDPVQ